MRILLHGTRDVALLMAMMAPGCAHRACCLATCPQVTTHDFVPDCCASGTVPRVHLLYRPGHYDILYAKGG